MAQNVVITGHVVSDLGQNLEGAQVYIQELNVGVPANAAGHYRLTIPGERARGQTVTLRVRMIGYVPGAKEMVLSPGEQTVDFTLKTDVQRLSEVVTTGASGGTEQAKMPFSVTKITSAEMPVPASSPLGQIAGKVPGANILGSSGRPGTSPSILMRGPKSMNAAGRSQDPLVVVDGVIVNSGLADIDPQDIESVEVVKGAAGSTMYGSQAGNGVISITTKRARNAGEGVRFNVRTEFGMSDIERKIGIAQRHALFLD
jgi:TonB-dependent SusC/RagA subfamily outer membrane receptor